MLTTDQKNKLISVINTLPVEVVYLFGSQANNSANKLSDYDFAILFSAGLDSKQRFDLRLDLISKFSTLLKSKVDVLDLTEVPYYFKYEAIKPRSIIYEKTNSQRADFEYLVLRDYFDQMYYLKQSTKDYLHHLAH